MLTDDLIPCGVRKVYSLLAVELALTFGVMAILILVKDIRYYLIDHPETAPIAGGVFLLIVIFIACSQPCQRMFPVNLIAISSMALCEGVVLGAIAAYYSVCIIVQSARKLLQNF